jgi:hypothetical protein
MYYLTKHKNEITFPVTKSRMLVPSSFYRITPMRELDWSRAMYYKLLSCGTVKIQVLSKTYQNYCY